MPRLSQRANNSGGRPWSVPAIASLHYSGFGLCRWCALHQTWKYAGHWQAAVPLRPVTQSNRYHRQTREKLRGKGEILWGKTQIGGGSLS